VISGQSSGVASRPDHLADALDVGVREPGPRRQAEALCEKRFAGAIAMEGGVLENRLEVHRFPERSGLNPFRLKRQGDKGLSLIV